MQIIFVVLIIFALLGGLLSKFSPDQSSEWGGPFFNALGFKSKEQIQREQLDKLLHVYLKDQVQYLDDSKEEIESLSNMVEHVSNKDNVDLLRLKFLMKQFEDLNVLMIENGKQLITFNEDQKKKNKRRAKRSREASALSKSDQKEFLEKQKDTLEKQAEIINLFQQMENNSAIKGNPQLFNQLNTLSSKTSTHLGHLRQEQEQIQNLNQRSIQDNSYAKERMNDLITKNNDAMKDNRARLEDQTRQINERLRDQLEKIKDKR